MELELIKQKKFKLHDDITKLLNEFTEETDLPVQSIYLYHLVEIGMKHPKYTLEIEVKI